MSNTGLFTGVYQQISGVADLIDDVLLDSRQQEDEQALAARRKLSKRLSSIIESTHSLSTKIIAILIEDSNQLSAPELKYLTDKLSVAQMDNTVIDILERLANVLEIERTKALARMRSNQ
jgi:hypothetical protein